MNHTFVRTTDPMLRCRRLTPLEVAAELPAAPLPLNTVPVTRSRLSVGKRSVHEFVRIPDCAAYSGDRKVSGCEMVGALDFSLSRLMSFRVQCGGSGIKSFAGARRMHDNNYGEHFSDYRSVDEQFANRPSRRKHDEVRRNRILFRNRFSEGKRGAGGIRPEADGASSRGTGYQRQITLGSCSAGD